MVNGKILGNLRYFHADRSVLILPPLQTYLRLQLTHRQPFSQQPCRSYDSLYRQFRNLHEQCVPHFLALQNRTKVDWKKSYKIHRVVLAA